MEGVKSYEIVLRFLALLITLTASILQGFAKETVNIPVKLVDTLPPLQLTVTAKWQYLSAFVYLLVSNSIASSYAAGSLILLLMGSVQSMKKKNGKGMLVVIILDVVIVGLLFSGIGAALGVGVIGRFGNSHLRWRKVCDVFGGICRQLTAVVGLSLVAAVLFLWLVVTAVFNLHKKSMIAAI